MYYGVMLGPSRRVVGQPKNPEYSLSFDGVDDVVNCGTCVLAPGAAITVEAWIRATAVYGYPRVVGRESLWGLTLGQPAGIRWFGSGVDKELASAVITLGRWYHVALVYDGAYIRAVLNGTSIGSSVPLTGDLTASSTVPVTIGNRNALDRPFSGTIRDCRVWSVARTDAEILASMRAKMLDPTNPDLIGYWKLDEGSGDTAHDSSQYGNHGTIIGASWVEV